MTDVLIRDIPDDVLARIDAHATRMGLSRVEYIRRRLTSDANALTGEPLTAEDLQVFATTFADLADPEIMDKAWR